MIIQIGLDAMVMVWLTSNKNPKSWDVLDNATIKCLSYQEESLFWKKKKGKK